MSTIGLHTEPGTRADALRAPQIPQPTKTSQDEEAELAGARRTLQRQQLEHVTGEHNRSIERLLSARTDEAAKRTVQELLNELADLGFAWRQIAQLVGVTVPALRKWRQGEPATGANRRTVARLAAFVHLVHADHLVDDVPSWMEMPLSTSHITGLDVYRDGGEILLVLLAANHHTSDDVLDIVEPGWREQQSDRFEITIAGDGQPVIRVRPKE